MAGALDEFAALASEFASTFDNGEGGGDAGVTLLLTRMTGGTYAPGTGRKTGATPSEYLIVEYVRSRSVQSTVPVGSGMRKVEEFTITVTQAAMETANWPAGVLPDESCTVTLTDADNNSVVYPVVGAERELGETLVKIKVRRDMGTAA